MKITKQQLKQIIKEELEEAFQQVPRTAGGKPVGSPAAQAEDLEAYKKCLADIEYEGTGVYAHAGNPYAGMAQDQCQKKHPAGARAHQAKAAE